MFLFLFIMFQIQERMNSIIPIGYGLKDLSKKDFLSNIRTTKILHFAGAEKYKPWRINYIGLRCIKKMYKHYVLKTNVSKSFRFAMNINTILFPFFRLYYCCFEFLYKIYCFIRKYFLS